MADLRGSCSLSDINHEAVAEVWVELESTRGHCVFSNVSANYHERTGTIVVNVTPVKYLYGFWEVL